MSRPLTYYFGKKHSICSRFTRVHALVMNKYAWNILEKYLDTDKGCNEVNSFTEYGHTPLMLAAMNMGNLYNPKDKHNKYEVVNLLLFNGANVDALDPEGNSILMLAVKYNTFPNESELLEFVRYLIGQYADTFVTNFYGRTLIDICYARGYEKVMKYVLHYNKLLSRIKS